MRVNTDLIFLAEYYLDNEKRKKRVERGPGGEGKSSNFLFQSSKGVNS